MTRNVIFLIAFIFLMFSCKNEKTEIDKSSDGLSHEDVLSLEKSSVFTNETLVYKGIFEGNYSGDKIILKLTEKSFLVDYKGQSFEGELFKKDDGSLIELAPKKKKLPFQFLRWSDNSEIMILNEDGMADDNGENYLTRISEK
ncbi:hypothetical protein HX088_12395 [Empedobacter sp. 225-1]|uniref:hypothetical protein n=1 Tax=unclassified Empedobacter TaxID=2643773 RepID=UPI002578BD9F|nr:MULTISPECIES: hypothetical protein [unclassified Empedobacter]MDM1524066.1 hypothetical protein [Empedobacter sp. 225-1]MDM1544009.1 hypothetical protein [Empedobacter sp. 189-2]